MTTYNLDFTSRIDKDDAYFYISTGALTRMHTLKLFFTEQRVVGSGGYLAERDYYIQNLSTDADKAMTKAKKFADANSIRLINDGDLLELEEIRRRSSEAVALAEAEKEEAYQATQRARQDALMDIIDQGIFPFGKYRDERFDSVYEYDKGYLVYLINSDLENLDVVSMSLKNALFSLFPKLKLPKYDAVKYFGEVKTRYKNIKAKVISDFGFDGYYGYTYVTKFLLETGEILLYMGGTPQEIEVSEDVMMDFTVKSHDEYEGEKQTKILRIKLLEVL